MKLTTVLKTTACIAATMVVAGTAGAQTLRASHQWPQGDVRHEMVQVIADELAAGDSGLTVQIYPAASLYDPYDQWSALTQGQLDISAFPLDYASGRHPVFSATLMPGLVRNHDRAERMNDSEFMAEIKKVVEEAGVVILADTWLGGSFASTEQCITSPETIKGQVTRAAGPMFEQMLAGAGASIASMPSSEIYTAMQTGVLDAANTSSGSFTSYRIYEQAVCLTAPGENALWFMYEPILMSKQSFDELSPEQQEAVMAAGQASEDFFAEQARSLDQEMIDAFKEAGVEVVEMSEEDYDAWLAIAQETSYKTFAEEVEGGQELIDMALSVE